MSRAALTRRMRSGATGAEFVSVFEYTMEHGMRSPGLKVRGAAADAFEAVQQLRAGE